MGKRSKYRRDSIRCTDTWIKTQCLPRITEKDKTILSFIYYARIATSKQIAQLYFEGKYKNKYCTRRLRILYDLYCIDRFFPLLQEGSSPQHVYLDKVGAKILNVNLPKISTNIYKHTTLVTEFNINAYQLGLYWGEKERKIGNFIADIYYPEYKLAVEIDTGTSSLTTIKKKGELYSQFNLNIIFVTTHIDRASVFFSQIPQNKGINIGTYAKDIYKSISQFKSTLNIERSPLIIEQHLPQIYDYNYI